MEVIGAFPADRVTELDVAHGKHSRQLLPADVFAVEKPGHTDGTATRSFQFFDHAGNAALKVFLNFGGPLLPERELLFNELRTKFKR